MNCEFYCKGKQLADYLIKHGSKLIRIDNGNIYVFESDDSIDKGLEQWEIDKKKYLF